MMITFWRRVEAAISVELPKASDETLAELTCGVCDRLGILDEATIPSYLVNNFVDANTADAIYANVKRLRDLG